MAVQPLTFHAAGKVEIGATCVMDTGGQAKNFRWGVYYISQDLKGWGVLHKKDIFLGNLGNSFR